MHACFELNMDSTPDMAGKGGSRRKRTPGPFKGVRMRKWGRWVSEIRVPKSRTRIWLGSYDAPEKAARAYDAALYCLHGVRGRFNFPTEKRPELPDGSSTQLSKMDIKAIAAKFASPACVPMSISSPATLATPDLPVSDKIEDLHDVGEAITTANVPVSESFWLGGFLDDPIIPLEPDWISDLL